MKERTKLFAGVFWHAHTIVGVCIWWTACNAPCGFAQPPATNGPIVPTKATSQVAPKTQVAPKAPTAPKPEVGPASPKAKEATPEAKPTAAPVLPVIQSAVEEKPAEPLPESFNRFRQIYFFRSQAAELLPSSFRPIDVADLEAQLQRLDGGLITPVDAPQLIRSVYVASLDRDRLVSNQSYWDISYGGREPARLSMGVLGFALKVENNDFVGPNSGKIVSDLNGETSIVVPGDVRVPFAWTAAGRSIDRGFSFDIKVPASIQTRLLIEVPRDLEVQAIDGVGRALPSPPPEAGNAGTVNSLKGSAKSWYSIDAGGLSRIRLRLTQTVRGDAKSILPVRQASIQYELQPQSIRFTTRMLVDARPGGSLPLLSVENGSVTSIRIGGSVVTWSELNGPDAGGIQIDSSRIDSSSSNGTMNITVDGEAAWSSGGGSQALPWLQWKGCQPILVAPEMQTQIRLDRSLHALRIQIPDQWRFLPTAASEDGSRIYRCVGSLVPMGPTILARPDEEQSEADSVLRLSASSTQFQAQFDASVLMNDEGPQPVQLRMDGGWVADLVTIPSSGRIIDQLQLSDPATRRHISIWPTSDELVDRRLHIRIIGSLPIRATGGRVEFPATSFATIQNCRNRVVALLTPPSGFNWTGDVALRTTRITLNELSPIHKNFLGEIGADSLLIDLNEGRVPPLLSRRPDIAFDSTSRLTLQRDGDRLVETCLVACDSLTTDIQSVAVDLGNPAGRPPMQWSAFRIDGSSRRISSTHLIRPEDLLLRDSVGATPSPDSTAPAQGNEVWQLELGERGEREVLLVGRREYKFAGAREIPLPSVPSAANQNAQAIIMPSLGVNALGESVFKVPPLRARKSPLYKYGAVAIDTEAKSGAVVLRYDATEKPSVVVESSHRATEQPLIWRETVRIEASNRGGDLVTAIYDVDRDTDLLIKHDLNLRLVSVTDANGGVVEHEASPSQLQIKSLGPIRRIITHWTRSTFSGSIARKWAPPRLEAKGIVLRHDWKLLPAADTFVPSTSLLSGASPLFPSAVEPGTSEKASLFGSIGIPDNQAWNSEKAILIEPTSATIWLIDSGLCYTLVSMIGLCFFALGWWMTLRWPWLAATVWIGSLVPPMFFLASYSLWASAVNVPFAAGCLIAVTIAPLDRLGRLRARTQIELTQGVMGMKKHWDDVSGLSHGKSSVAPGFSWMERIPFWLLFVLATIAVIGLTGVVGAQEPNAVPANQPNPSGLFEAVQPLQTTAPVPLSGQASIPASTVPLLLVPTDEKGDVAGSKVYLPKALHAELFRNRDTVAEPTRVRSASYRLRFDGASETETTAELEVRYQLEDSKLRSETRLPFRATQLRSVQWLTESDTRSLRWSADGDSSVKISLPATSNASLLVRLNCEVQSPTRMSRRIRVAIPPVAGSTLVVDAGLAVQRLELSKVIGEVDSQPDLGRLTASLGSVNEIDLSVTYREAARSLTSIAQRRYWINAGYDRTNVECEIELNDPAIRRGASIPIALLDGTAPIITTNDWLITSTEITSPTRQQLTLQAQRDNPGPIRCLWEIQSSAVASGPVNDPAKLVIPEIISVGNAPTPQAVIALSTAPGLRLVPQRIQLSINTPNSPVPLAPKSPLDAPPSIPSVPSLGSLVPPKVETTTPPSLAGPQGPTIPANMSVPPSLAIPPSAGPSSNAPPLLINSGDAAIPSMSESTVTTPSTGPTATESVMPPATSTASPESDRTLPAPVSSTSAEAIDAFVSSWKGFRGTASEVIVSPSPLPRFLVAAPTPRAWQSDEVHHLHVRPGELQLSYVATITPGDRLIGPLRVVLPVGCELRALTMNGVSINTVPRRIGNREEVSLNEPSNADPIRLRVILHMHAQALKFNPPRVSVEPVQIIKGTYTLSRDQSLLIEEVVDGGLIEAESPAMGTAEQLAGGWIPCWTWRLDQVQSLSTDDSSRRPQLSGVYRIEPRDVTVDCQQRTSLVWDQTRWVIDTVLRLRGAERAVTDGVAVRERIDFLNVELPTIWCDSLTVEPAVAWSRQPSIDPATQIIRIRPEPFADPDGMVTIRLRGKRSVDADARLEVPTVRVLGGGKRDVFMTVPTQVDRRPLDWEASAAISAKLPDELLRIPMLDDVEETEDTSSNEVGEQGDAPVEQIVFRSVAGNASIRLVPSRSESSDPLTTVADIQLFASDNKQTAMICRWDVCPGRKESLAISIPQEVKPIEVWVDDQIADWSLSGEELQIRLPLSRLAQGVVLVAELESHVRGHKPRLPTIRELPAQQTWVSLFSATANSNAIELTARLDSGWSQGTADERRLAMASSILAVTEASLRRATDRSQDEVLRWIEPWDRRFNELGEASVVKEPWQELAISWKQYLGRIVGDSNFVRSKEASYLTPPDHWQVVSIATHEGPADTLPTIRAAYGASSLATSIRFMLILVVAIGVTMLMWRARMVIAPIATQPAAWLFATGLASTVVAPIPVAVAICVVALSTPLINASTSRSKR